MRLSEAMRSGFAFKKREAVLCFSCWLSVLSDLSFPQRLFSCCNFAWFDFSCLHLSMMNIDLGVLCDAQAWLRTPLGKIFTHPPNPTNGSGVSLCPFGFCEDAGGLGSVRDGCLRHQGLIEPSIPCITKASLVPPTAKRVNACIL